MPIITSTVRFSLVMRRASLIVDRTELVEAGEGHKKTRSAAA
jgi:hypothetical protein